MGFDDLEDAIEEQDQQNKNSNAESTVDTEPPQSEMQTEADNSAKVAKATKPDEDEMQAQSKADLSTPAFEFDDAVQKGWYARENSWSEFNAAVDFEIKRELHSRDVENVTRSEITEAVLWTAVEQPELVAEKLIEMREGKM